MVMELIRATSPLKGRFFIGSYKFSFIRTRYVHVPAPRWGHTRPSPGQATGLTTVTELCEGYERSGAERRERARRGKERSPAEALSVAKQLRRSSRTLDVCGSKVYFFTNLAKQTRR